MVSGSPTPAPGAPQRICVFTGTRAEYGLLKPLIAAIAASPRLELSLLVTGAHLAPSQGLTWREIEADGFPIAERIEIMSDSDSNVGIATATGLGLMRYAEALQRLAPAALVILGDRYEAFAAAAAATICHVPVAHLHGGELTFGAIDEAFRHAISKMSQLHFTSTAAYRNRVIQLGEAPERVHDVGALGVSNALNLTAIPRQTVLERLGLQADARYLLVTFHPETGGREAPESQVEELLAALARFPDLAIVFTGANADAGGRTVNRMLTDLAAREPGRVRFSQSLGMTLYLAAVRQAQAVVGNSSSGVIEVPSFGVPTVDIGERQSGRARAASVLWAAAERDAIASAVAQAISPAFRQLAATVDNPYEKPDTVSAILRVLENTDFAALPAKRFHDLTAPG